MTLLGLNCGLGNADIGTLPISALDLEAGWINFARQKTGVLRRCPLWPETVAAIREVIDARPEPELPADGKLVFLTANGHRWWNTAGQVSRISTEFTRLLKRLKLHKPGIGYYTFRHVFRTIADEVKDEAAVDHVMGHLRHDIASRHYRERISDERLKAVSDHVRHGYFPASPEDAIAPANVNPQHRLRVPPAASRATARLSSTSIRRQSVEWTAVIIGVGSRSIV